MWSKVGMDGEHHRYYKHNKFRQNPRGDPKFLVDLTRNDPYFTTYVCIAIHFKLQQIIVGIHNYTLCKIESYLFGNLAFEHN